MTSRRAALILLIFGVLAAAGLLWMSILNDSLTPSEERLLAEEYVREHISELSPEPAVLGGTFFVTALSLSEGSGVVEYEDGHIALRASFIYEVNPDGVVTISAFELEPDN